MCRFVIKSGQRFSTFRTVRDEFHRHAVRSSRSNIHPRYFRDNFAPGHITFVEWSEKAGECLPEADLIMTLTPEGDGRRVTFVTPTNLGAIVLSALNKEWTSHAEL